METASGGVWGAVAIAVSVLGSVLVARISRPRDHQEDDPKAAPAPAELTTIAGLAQEMVRLQGKVAELETAQSAQQEHSRLQDLTVGALRRYVRRLETALQDAGVAVPPPDAADAHLIRVP
jgi:hypothetical protein